MLTYSLTDPLMHRPVPGNVYNSDLSFMDPNDTLSNSLLANTSSHLLWPGATGDVVPRHLTPGVSFADHHRPPYRADAFGVYDTVDDCGLNHSDQSSHKDWITQGTWDIHAHPLAGQQCSFVIPDFIPHSTREDTMPFFDTNPPSVPINSHNVRIETPSLPVESLDNSNTCNSIPELTPWGVFNPLEPGFDIQSILPTLCEGPSNVIHQCQWFVDGSPCNEYYPLGNNLKHSVSQHLREAHNLLPAGGKSTQRCLWLGCRKELKQESIVRHILTVHLHIMTACKGCGTFFARQDSLQRHMRNSCGDGTGKQ